ncbi:hypothetical protein BH09GEM1_BH09GEM1_37970 [soil metagenome]
MPVSLLPWARMPRRRFNGAPGQFMPSPPSFIGASRFAPVTIDPTISADKPL